MYQLKQSQTARPLLFLMLDSSDHVSAKTGLSPTVTLSKNGGSFASPAGAVTEVANGWYKVAGNATDAGTLGPLVLHATGSGADPCDVVYDVVPELAGQLATGAVVAGTFGAGAVDASALAADAGTEIAAAVWAAATRTLSSGGLDAVLVESGISAGSSLTNDADAQLTSINARQALALAISALGGILSGGGTATEVLKGAGLPSGNSRITATVDGSGNRSGIVLKLPT